MSAGIIAGAASGVASSKGGQQVLGSVAKGIDSQVAATQKANESHWIFTSWGCFNFNICSDLQSGKKQIRL